MGHDDRREGAGGEQELTAIIRRNRVEALKDPEEDTRIATYRTRHSRGLDSGYVVGGLLQPGRGAYERDIPPTEGGTRGARPNTHLVRPLPAYKSAGGHGALRVTTGPRESAADVGGEGVEVRLIDGRPYT